MEKEMQARLHKRRLQNPRGAASPNHPRRLAAHQKQMRALELRLGGATFQQIADSLGYSHRMLAFKAVREARRKLPQELGLSKLRFDERERLDRIQMALWPRVQSGDLKAISLCIRLSKRRCELDGLDKTKEIKLKGEVDARLQGPCIKVYRGLTPVQIAESNGEAPKDPERRALPPNRSFGH